MIYSYVRQFFRAGIPALAILSSGLAQASDQCNIESIQSFAPSDTTITAATETAQPVPHCRIEGYVTTTNPGPNQVNFRIQLPDHDWNGRYFFIGLGGSAGYVPTDSQVPAGNPLLAGFAVAGTDTGRQGHMLDWNFIGESRAKAVDHQHRGAHVTNVAAQQITKSYYDTDSMYRYMSGCSGGGRMATEAVQRYPDDFDGVIIGAPGGRSSATILSFINAAQQMTREPGSWLSPAKLAMLDQKVMAQCDTLDGAKDNMIWDHRACHYDFDTLLCKNGDGPECLTAPEIKSVKALLAGPRSPKGQIKVGFPISNMASWSGFLGPVPPPWSPEPSMQNMPKSSGAYVIATTMANVYLRPGYDILKEFDFNRQADVDAWWAGVKRVDFGAPYSADIKGYQKSGGKLILWNGVSDPCCIDTETEQYYKDAAKKVGGLDKIDEFTKFYRIPGMAHCGGGTGPMDAPDQLIRAMIDWVENDKEPAAVVAHRGVEKAKMLFADPKTGQISGVIIPPPAGEPRDFLLCPYPQVSRFDASKKNDPNAVFNADNWSCENI